MTERPSGGVFCAELSECDDRDWADRSAYWRSYKPARTPGRPRKFRYREPLILCGHGARIRVDRGTLLIRNGFSYYPQKVEEVRFFPGDANLPDRIIILDGSGGISFDALAWLFEQQITLVQIDWRGRIQVVGANTGYVAKPEFAEAQRVAQHGRRQIEISKWLIEQKIAASIAMLQRTIPTSEIKERSLLALKQTLQDIKAVRSTARISTIFGIEGRAAVHYFRAQQGLPIHWKRTNRKLIPDAWHEIGPRKMGWRKRSQTARHPVNAMLNYGYAILASQVRSQIVAAGLDPTVGIMHGTSQNRIPLVYDLMEPLRPAVDARVLEFVLSNTFSPGDFTISRYGGCRLNPQLAQTLVTTLHGTFNASPVVPKFVQRLRR